MPDEDNAKGTFSGLSPEELFQRTFGVSKQELIKKGEDPDDYYSKNIRRALRIRAVRRLFVPESDVQKYEFYLWSKRF